MYRIVRNAGRMTINPREFYNVLNCRAIETNVRVSFFGQESKHATERNTWINAKSALRKL